MEGLECGTVVGTNPYKTKSHQLFSAMPADWPSAGRGRKQRTLQGLYEVRSTNADAPAMAMRPSEVVLARARAAGKGGVATDGAVASPFRLPLPATGLAGVAPRSRDEGPNESIRQDVAMSPCRHVAMPRWQQGARGAEAGRAQKRVRERRCNGVVRFLLGAAAQITSATASNQAHERAAGAKSATFALCILVIGTKPAKVGGRLGPIASSPRPAPSGSNGATCGPRNRRLILISYWRRADEPLSGEDSPTAARKTRRRTVCTSTSSPPPAVRCPGHHTPGRLHFPSRARAKGSNERAPRDTRRRPRV